MGGLIINHCSTIAAATRFFNHSSSSSSSSSLSTTAIAVSVTTPPSTPISSSRLHIKLGGFNSPSSVVVVPCIFNNHQRGRARIVIKAAAAAGIDGSSSLPDPPAEDIATAAVPAIEIQNLPLESKQQLLLEQKLRMKLAKKIRLRRKRLVRKRQMRKKGRWPPSKVKKNKNV